MGDNANFNLIEASILEFTKVPSNAGAGGAIDFHWNGSSVDFTSRIIEDAQGRISVYGNLNVGGAITTGSTPVLP
jgi:hypothetical protein